MSAARPSPGDEEPGNPYIGWIAGTILILVIIGIGAAFWVRYHGF